MELQLTGKTALVTGSYRGTGAVIARRLLDEGVHVLVHGLLPGQAEAGVAELGGGTPVTGDITCTDGCNAVLQQVSQHQVDLLINNYGTADAGSWSHSDSDDWIVDYEKNVLSAQRLIRGLLPQLQTRPFTRVINLGTVGSTKPNARMPGYYTAKGALATMTQSLAQEVAGTPVRVNLVSPGLIRTPEVEAAYLKRAQRTNPQATWADVESELAADVPIRRIVTREEVADLVVFLCSPLADGIHGQNIRVDGGALGIVT